MAEESVLERLNKGESLFEKPENFQITMIALLFSNLYVLMTFYICDFT